MAAGGVLAVQRPVPARPAALPGAGDPLRTRPEPGILARTVRWLGRVLRGAAAANADRPARRKELAAVSPSRPRASPAAGAARQDRLETILRRHYDPVLDEPVPEDMLELARKLGSLDDRQG